MSVQEPLYAEFSSWANPHEMEAQLAKAAERRKRALTGQDRFKAFGFSALVKQHILGYED